jgi:post-segregation antitoxin (ccd killing protein)
VDFNHCIIINVLYIIGKPVLHIVDEGTRYQAGRWLQNISAKHTWDALKACWIDTYLGPPDQITADAGKNFISKEFDQYVAQRARGAYIASVCQPEAAYDLSVAAQAVEPTEKDVSALNKRLQWQIENAARGLRFVQLAKESLQLLVFTDASFANNKDLSSQISYVLVMADANGRANILHWSSIKCKRVTRSVLASELYAMAHGFNISASLKTTINKALNINLPLVLYTDSKSLYDCLVKLGTT